MYRQYLSGFTKPPVILLALFTALLLPFASLPELTHASMSNTRADAWNTDYNNAASWMTNDGGGVDVYSNGSTVDFRDCSGNIVSTYAAACKRSVNSVVSGAENQCVELFNRLYLTKGWISSTWTGNGSDLYNIATLPTGFSKQDNTHTTFINPGDAITFTNVGTGHVVMVDSVSGTGTTKTVNVVSQNTQGVLWTVSWDTSTNTLTQTYLGINYGVQGIIHRPTSGGGTTSPGLGGGNASSWASGRFDAWIEQASPTNGSNLGHIWFNGAWQPWETIGAPNNELMASQPAAVSWSYGTTPNRIDVFARGQAGDLIHAWYDGTQWYPWESLGGCVEGSPTVTSWGPGRLDVFVEGCNTTGGNLWHTWYDSTGWHAFENIATNMVMTASPSAVSWGSGRMDIFSRGTDSSLIHTFFDGSWHNWESLGGCIIGSPAASSWVSGRVDAWVEGCNTTGGNFYQTWWSAPTGWSAFNLLSPTYQISGVLGAVSWGSNRIDMFTRASNNTLDHWWFDGTSFQGPENKGGAIAP